MSELLISTIKPELLVLVPVLYLIGTAIKKSRFLNDNIIRACEIISVNSAFAIEIL